MSEAEFYLTVRDCAVREGAPSDDAHRIALSVALKERRLQPPAWQMSTADALAASSVAALKSLHPEIFREEILEDITPRSPFLTRLRTELLERFGISDVAQVSAILPLAIKYNSIACVHELEPDLFIAPPTRDELFRLLIETNPVETATDADRASYARSRVAAVFAVGEEWLEATSLRRRARILNELAHEADVSIGSEPPHGGSSLAHSAGLLA
jgi:hypothetical protein